jgi:uncharacterized protein (TIGR02996 family)
VPRYEFVEGSSSKFWDISRQGVRLTTKFGKIGSNGQTQIKDYASEDAAEADMQKQIAAKLKKGYEAAGGAAPAPAKAAKAAPAKAAPAKAAPAKAAPAKAAPAAKGAGEAWQRVEFEEGSSSKFWEARVDDKRLYVRFGKLGTDGQTQIKDLANHAMAMAELEKQLAGKLKKGYQPAGGAGGGAQNAELEGAILEDPGNDEAYLVYADWLQTQGDPRGELITVQHKLAKASGAEKKKLAKAEADLLAEHAAAFWPKKLKAAIDEEATGSRKDRWDLEYATCAASWRNGFLASVRVGLSYELAEEKDYRIAPIVSELLKHPSGRFLEELTIGALGIADEYDYGEVVGAIVRAGAPALRTLFLATFSSEHTELSWSHLGKLEKLWPAAPRLESLTLRAGSMSLGKLELPALRKLRVETGGFDKKNVKEICDASWPALESLHLYLGQHNYGGNSKVKDVLPILEGKNLPALRHLGLMNCEYTDEICKALPGSGILAQLETLDLSLGTMSDVGARAIADNQDAFSHLTSLVLSENFLTDAGIKALKGLGKKVNTASQKERYDWDEDGRYTSVGE